MINLGKEIKEMRYQINKVNGGGFFEYGEMFELMNFLSDKAVDSASFELGGGTVHLYRDGTYQIEHREYLYPAIRARIAT